MIMYDSENNEIGIRFDGPAEAMEEIEAMLLSVLKHTNDTYCNGSEKSLVAMKGYMIEVLSE